jgi:hypothetical protein
MKRVFPQIVHFVDSIVKEEKFVKGSVIAEIPPCERRKICEKAP